LARKKFLIIGAGGQVGRKLSALAKQKGHYVIGAFNSTPVPQNIEKIIAFDKTNEQLTNSHVTDLKPDIIIDTAALHNVDYCESHPEEAMKVNRDGTANVAKSASRIGAKFVFISTDFVFDGKNAPYAEDSEPNPLSVYARSKLLGEHATLSLNEDSIVCRPAVIYSWVVQEGSIVARSSSGKPLNFGAWLVSQLLAGKQANIVTDQITSPTLADDLAGALLAIAENPLTRGVYHTAGATPLSRYEFCVRLAKKMSLDEQLIHPIESAQLKQIAKRPPNSSLVSERIRKDVGYRMMTLDEQLDSFVLNASRQS
jgi:dTDP-4-dehydrorhamnose reductase